MEYTFEQYCADLDKILYLEENFDEKEAGKIASSLSKYTGRVSDMVKMIKYNLSTIKLVDIIKALKEVDVFTFLKLTKFSISKMASYINKALSVFDNQLLKVIVKLQQKGVFDALVKGTMTMDKVLQEYPILKKMTGPVVAGAILMIWLNMTFSGKFSGDMDLTKMFKSAVGKFSLQDVFATTHGIKMLALLTTGVLSAGALSFPWLAATGANLALAIIYTGFKNKNLIKAEELKKLKDKIVKKRITEGFLTQLNESDKNKNKAFVNKIYSMGQRNPIGRGIYFYMESDNAKENAVVRLEMFGMDDFAHISEIVVAEDKGGKGYGDHIMKLITKQADKDKIDLSLDAVPIAHQGKKIPKSTLRRFYKKHGFVGAGGDRMERKQKTTIKLSGKMKRIQL